MRSDQGGLRVTPALHQDSQHHALVVDRTPKPVLRAGDRQHDLIHVPIVSGRRQPASDLVGKQLPELQRLLAHGLWLTIMPRAASSSSPCINLG
jgi:hypothetical protein